MNKSILISLLSISLCANAQYKADNVKYTTVFPQELCQTLMANANFALLDVRSQGEFDDTLSSSEALNLGHLKGAMHIDIRELPKRWKELLPYKDKPLFIYCSHSQRSRRASRLLSDSGFTKVFNVNGGLTNFYDLGIQSNPCAGFEIVTSVPYKIISPAELAVAGKKRGSYYIIDLRSDSAFKGIGSEESRVHGSFSDAINIPTSSFAAASVHTNKPILLIDESGDESPAIAKALIEKGIKNVAILFGGMEGWTDYLVEKKMMPPSDQKRFADYDVISAMQLQQMAAASNPITIIDVRSSATFANKSPNYWQNIGNVKSAINIPAAELSKNNSLPVSKTTIIVLYGFNSEPEVYQSAKWLREQGYQHVAVLNRGIWGIRWGAHNLKDHAALNDLVINVPADNQ